MTCVAQVQEDAFPDFTNLKNDSINKTEEGKVFDFDKAYKLIDSASINLCEKDTAKTIELLSDFMNEYPYSGIDRLVGVKLGQLYTETGDFFEAEKVFYTVLSTTYLRKDATTFSSKEIENCALMIDGNKFKEADANACFGLYYLMMKEKSYEKAYEYLILANTTYLPYKECGNGVEMSIINHNKYFVDYFLKTGDTTKAINKSLDIILEDYRYRVSKENVGILRAVLLKKYTSKQINDEIEKGILSLYKKTIIENGEIKENIYFCLFGYFIDAINKEYENVNEGIIRAKLRDLNTLKALKGEKY